MSADCDDDTLLVLAQSRRTDLSPGTPTCFAEARDRDGVEHRVPVDARGDDRAAHRRQPEGSYTARLLPAASAASRRRSARKASKPRWRPSRATIPTLVGECADLLYHLLVLLQGAQPVARAGRRTNSRRATASGVPGSHPAVTESQLTGACRPVSRAEASQHPRGSRSP